MTLVTLEDKQRLLQLIGATPRRRDEIVFSLMGKISWTDAQRRLAGQLLREATAEKRVKG